MLSIAFQGFPIWHRRPASHPSDDEALRNLWYSILRPDTGSSSQKRADARRTVKLNVALLHFFDLLSNGAVDGEISRLQANHIFTSLDSSLHDIDDFHQVHAGAIMNLSPFLTVVQQVWIDQGACVNDHISLRQLLVTFERNQLHITWACSNKMYFGHQLASLSFFLQETIIVGFWGLK